MYIKTDGWQDSEEPDTLADRYPYRYNLEIFVDEATKKKIVEEGQIQAIQDSLLDWFALDGIEDDEDWRLDIQ